MATDTQMLDWLLLAMGTQETEEANRITESLQAGFELGLRGRELLGAAMNTVRFDEVSAEKSTELVQAMIDERTDTERLDLLQSVLPDVEHILQVPVPSPDDFDVQVTGVRIQLTKRQDSARGYGLTIRAAIDNLRDVLERRDADFERAAEEAFRDATADRP